MDIGKVAGMVSSNPRRYPRRVLRRRGGLAPGLDRARPPPRVEQYVELPGRVVEVQPSAHFVVELDTGQRLLAHLAGRLRRNRIRIVLGDRVTVAVSAYDPKRGRIVYRA